MVTVLDASLRCARRKRNGGARPKPPPPGSNDLMALISARCLRKKATFQTANLRYFKEVLASCAARGKAHERAVELRR